MQLIRWKILILVVDMLGKIPADNDTTAATIN